MEDKIDLKIKSILKNLREAHEHSSQFYGKQLNPGEPFKSVNIMEMGLAFDSEDRLMVDFELACSEKYPDQFTPEAIEFLEKERERLTHRIRAWQNGQLPSKYKE